MAKRAQEAAKRPPGFDLGWIWEGFGRGLGGFWRSKLMFFFDFLLGSILGGLGGFLGSFGRGLGRILKDSG